MYWVDEEDLKTAFVSLNAPLIFPVVIILTQSVLEQLFPHCFSSASPVGKAVLVLGTVETLCKASLPLFGWHLLADDSSCQLDMDWFIQLLSAEAALLKRFRFFKPISLSPLFYSQAEIPLVLPEEGSICSIRRK